MALRAGFSTVTTLKRRIHHTNLLGHTSIRPLWQVQYKAGTTRERLVLTPNTTHVRTGLRIQEINHLPLDALQKVWCVRVPTEDHLIIVRRVTERGASGECVQASRPTVVSNSLLVGVHYKDREQKAEAERQAADERRKGGKRRVRERQSNYGTRKNEVVIPRTVMKEVQRKIQRSAETGEKAQRSADAAKATASSRKLSTLGPDDAKQESPVAATEQGTRTADEGVEVSHNSASSSVGGEEGAAAEPETPKGAKAVEVQLLPHRPPLLRVSSSTFFTQDDGGLCSVDPVTGKEGNEVYYLGIIDILQRYNALKKVEHGMKALTHDAAAVSCAPPNFYAERFLNSIGARMLGVDESLAWHAGAFRSDSISLHEMLALGKQTSEEGG